MRFLITPADLDWSSFGMWMGIIAGILVVFLALIFLFSRRSKRK
jgi:hypothetical protein